MTRGLVSTISEPTFGLEGELVQSWRPKVTVTLRIVMLHYSGIPVQRGRDNNMVFTAAGFKYILNC